MNVAQLGACLVAAWFAAATRAQQASSVAPPARFERVLWVSDPAARAGPARAKGYTAVQLGRGGDPAPIVAQGLGYYLDQPIGKGLLELRDAEWDPLPQAYQQTRDAAVLVRPGCFATPGLVARAATDAVAEAVRVAGPGLRFVALADEASATRHDAPLDTCRCEHCLRAFRVFAQQRHRTIDAVNQVLGTHFASFDDVAPLTTDQVRRRELGDTVLPRDLRPFVLRQQFVDEQYAEAVSTIAASVQRALPAVPVGLTGLQVPAAFGGNDPARLLPGLSLAEPYDIGGAVELAACLLRPSAHRYATLAPPDGEPGKAWPPLGQLVQAKVAAMAAQGLAGVVVWNDATVFGADGAETPFGVAVREGFARLGPVLDACAGAAIEPGPVWVLESQNSVRLWWMLDSAGDGMTWVRRFASYERTHSTSQAARLGWIRLLQDLGLQPYFVAESQLPERLLRERPRCLVLPASIALDDRCVQAIDAYVRSGGTVVADHTAALYDGHGLLRPAGGLDEVFGITARSLRWEDLLVRQGSATAANARQLSVAEKQLRGRLGERRPEGEVFLEHRLGRGNSVYLNAPVCDYVQLRLDEQRAQVAFDLRRRVRAVLQQAGVEPPCEVRGAGLPTCIERVPLVLRDGRRVLVVRLHALDDPALLRRLSQDGPRAVQVDLPVERHLRHLGGEDLGIASRFDLRLDPFGALFLEVVAK